MKRHRMGLFRQTLSLIMAFGLIASTSSISLAETDRALYGRLGGYDAISSVVDVFLTKVWEDPVV